MKVSLILIFVLVQVSASTYSQITKLTLSMEKVTLSEFFEEIEDASEFRFFYDSEEIDPLTEISVNANETSIENILTDIFVDSDFAYEIFDSYIILKKKDLSRGIKRSFAKQQEITIKGKVTDPDGVPLPGVNVIEIGTTNGSITNIDGEYSISITTASSSLQFSFIGYLAEDIVIGDQLIIDVTLVPDITELDEIVIVGYGSRKKATLTGAVASIDNEEIVSTKNQNVQNTLTGKIPGVRVIQRTAEPGTFDNHFDIRGFGAPLIVIDGVPRDNFTRLDPNDIESISVLKDASAAVYGVRAGNGVVLITTKKGQKGKTKFEYSFMKGFQNPSGLPEPLNAIDRFTILNESSMHRENGPFLTFGDDVVQPYLDGTKKSTDWYGLVMQDNAPQSQQNLSVSGGSEKIDYYINMGYSYQEGFWKSGDLNYEKYNVRANMNASVTDNLKASLKVSGIIDEQNRPYRDSWEIFKNLWRTPSDNPYYANNNPLYVFETQSDWHPGIITDADVTGYKQSSNKYFQSSFSLDYNIPGIEGLAAQGMFGYDLAINDGTQYQKAFNTYHYDEPTDTYVAHPYQSPDNIRRSYGSNPKQLLQFGLTYKTTIAGKHSIDVLALFEQSVASGDNFYAKRELSIPLAYIFAGNSENQEGSAASNGIYKNVNKGYVGRIDYNYMEKYLLTFSFRRDGSSKFPSSKQWGFFPSYEAAWRISEEDFFKNVSALSVVSNLKVRASYGVLGDDGAAAYQFVTGYDYPYRGNAEQLPGGYLFDGWTNSLGFRSVANPNITWYTLKITNIGFDAGLWNGMLDITFDAYRRDRSGLLANRLLSLPLSFGANLPQENLNSDQTQGVDLIITHNNRINNDLSFRVSFNTSYTRTKNIYVERAQDGSSYAEWRNSPLNRYNDIWFGKGYVGQYQSYEEIATYPVYTNSGILPGDYIYEDWNEDGVIDNEDNHPIATTTNPGKDFNGRRNYPLFNYGFNIGVNYKGFDLNALLQGTARSYSAYGEMYRGISSNALDFFLDRWHPEDPKQDPYDPSTVWITGKRAYTGTAYDENSDAGIQNTAYLRLKSIEFGYTLPEELTKKVGINKLRVYTNAYNILTFTKAVGIDPEHPSDLYGYLYPMNKTVNFGINVVF